MTDTKSNIASNVPPSNPCETPDAAFLRRYCRILSARQSPNRDTSEAADMVHRIHDEMASEEYIADTISGVIQILNGSPDGETLSLVGRSLGMMADLLNLRHRAKHAMYSAAIDAGEAAEAELQAARTRISELTADVAELSGEVSDLTTPKSAPRSKRAPSSRKPASVRRLRRVA